MRLKKRLLALSLRIHARIRKTMYRNKMRILLIVFFFQAEDGIRDADVTGVQTCALPIYAGVRTRLRVPRAAGQPAADRRRHALAALAVATPDDPRRRGPGRGDHPQRRSVHRSEERRVGKECRSRW